MSIARGTVIRPVNFQMPVLQLPFEQIWSNMQQYQQQKDTFEANKDLMPETLPQSEPWARQYKEYVDKLSGAVTDAFSSGKTTEAMRALRQAQSELKREWSPGGLAYALQSQTSGYKKAMEEIREYAKKTKGPQYSAFYENQVRQQVADGLGYDPSSGTFNSVSTPKMLDEVIVGDEMDKFFKDWKSDKGVGIQKSADGYWYYKNSTERVSEEELTKAGRAFLQQPHVRHATQINGWYNAEQIRNAGLEADEISKQRLMMKQSLETAAAEQRQNIASMEAMLKSGKRSSVMEVQQSLKQSGYDPGTIDGIAGSNTKAAFQKFKSEVDGLLEQRMQQNLSAIDNMSLDAVMQNNFEDSVLRAYVPKYAYTHNDVSMIANQPALIRLKSSLQMSANNALIGALKATLVPPSTTNMFPITTEKVEVGAVIKDAKKAQEAYVGIDNEYRKNLPSSWQVNGFSKGGQPMPLAQVARIMMTATESAMQGGRFNPEAFKKALMAQKTQGMKFDVDLNSLAASMARPQMRSQFTQFYDDIDSAYSGAQAAKDVVNTIVGSVTDKDWETMARNFTVVNKSAPRTFMFGASDPGIRSYSVSTQEFKRMVLSGDDAAVASMQGYMQSKKGAGKETWQTSVTMIQNEALKPYLSQLNTIANNNVLSLVKDPASLTQDVRNALGIDKGGNQLPVKKGDTPLKFENVQFGTHTVAGVKKPVLILKSNKRASPIVLTADQVDPTYWKQMTGTLLAASVNPNNPKEIIDPQTFNSMSSLMHDIDNRPGTGLNSNSIYNMVRSGVNGAVGTSVVTYNTGQKADWYTHVIRDTDGQQYLVTTSNPSIANMMIENPGNFDSSVLDRDMSSYAVPIGNSLQSVNAAVSETKAAISRDDIFRDLLNNAYRIQTDKPNLTPAFMGGFGDMILNDEDY